MSDLLLSNLAKLLGQYQRLTGQLGDPAIIGTPRYQQVVKEQARLGRLMLPYERVLKAQADARGSGSVWWTPNALIVATGAKIYGFRSLGRE